MKTTILSTRFLLQHSLFFWLTSLQLALPSGVNAQYQWVTNGYQTITLTKYTGTGGTVVIPESITGLPVTMIGKDAFRNCSTVRSVVIPASVTSLEDSAF